MNLLIGEAKRVKGKSVLVTGGASFIGSHLVDTLIEGGAEVSVADDFSSGKLENFNYPFIKKNSTQWKQGHLTVFKGDLKDRDFTQRMVKDVDVVFHLAALHGGRGYIDS